MIEVKNIKKSYGNLTAIHGLSLDIQDGQVFGMIGTNGAGKSTLLRIMAGVLLPDEGEVLIDGAGVYENPPAKSKIFFIPDEAYFMPGSTPASMAAYYRMQYPTFDMKRFQDLLDGFSLDENRPIATFSKGMKKQVSLILGLSARTKYLFCDETFDGLDPLMRQAIKSLLAMDIENRNLTPVLTSHNLRELEDICDHVGLLHQGGVLLSKNLGDMKLGLQRMQIVFSDESERKLLEQSVPEIIKHDTMGKVHTYTMRISAAELEMVVSKIHPVFCEVLPLTLEEIFISETEVVGYDVSKVLFG